MNDSTLVFERIDTAVLTASAGTDASYPLTNLQDGRHGTQWMANANTIDQTLQIVFGAARKCTSLLVANHNFNSLGADSVDLEYYDGAVWTLLKTLGSLLPDPIYVNGFDQTRTTFRLIFNKDAGTLSAKPTVGMIFLGQEAALPLYLNNPKRGLKADIVRDESLSGLRFRSSPYEPRQTWKIDFGALKAVNNHQIWRWLDGVGVGLHPYWLKDMDDNWHFVGNDFDSLDGGSKGNVAFDFRNIQISEERPGAPVSLPGNYTV
jgi:hypothetical protein